MCFDGLIVCWPENLSLTVVIIVYIELERNKINAKHKNNQGISHKYNNNIGIMRGIDIKNKIKKKVKTMVNAIINFVIFIISEENKKESEL